MANHTPGDILMKDMLDDYAKKYADRFQIHYMVTSAGEKPWSGLTGHITAETLTQTMPKPSDDTIILFSGTPKFNDFMFKTLPEVGYAEGMYVKF